ncbi:hypothetical protein, partial [Thermogutta sp.]|uniref:hypothetical protein n=1 Tax=Thermogutta sp. TaxID=1962930 RepID=UPI0025EA3D2E
TNDLRLSLSFMWYFSTLIRQSSSMTFLLDFYAGMPDDCRPRAMLATFPGDKGCLAGVTKYW